MNDEKDPFGLSKMLMGPPPSVYLAPRKGYEVTKEVTPVFNGKFKKGDFVIVEEKKQKDYDLAQGQTLIYVTKDHADYKKEMQYHIFPSEMARMEMFGGIPLSDKNYKGVFKWYEADDFTLANHGQVVSRLAQVGEAKKFLALHRWKTGDCVQLTENITVKRGFFFFSFDCTIRKGTPAVIDTGTGDYDEEENDLDPNRGHAEVEEDSRTPIAEMKIGKWMLSDFLVPLVHLYFPESESEEDVQCTLIIERVFKLAEATLVLPTGYIEKIMRVVNRVVNRRTCEAIYEKLGLWQVCQKGRGALVLLYGPPGTGKTMTAEVIADRLKRPLIRVSLRMFDGQIMERLKSAFTRAQKYDAVLLLDEVDVFIRKRGENPLFDEHTAVFLRALEYYDGILFMTTNLVQTIDPAVFSRVHVCLGFDTVDEDRKAIWKSLLTEKLLNQVSGSPDDHEDMINKLAAIKINGREIKTVIQNAVSHAIYELKGAEIPDTTKWISRNYFLNEASQLQEQRDDLKKGN